MIESSHITLAVHRVHIKQILIFWRRVKPQEARGVPDQLVVAILDIFQRAANGPVDLAPKLAPGRAEREELVSNLYFAASSKHTK